MFITGLQSQGSQLKTDEVSLGVQEEGFAGHTSSTEALEVIIVGLSPEIPTHLLILTEAGNFHTLQSRLKIPGGYDLDRWGSSGGGQG